MQLGIDCGDQGVERALFSVAPGMQPLCDVILVSQFLRDSPSGFCPSLASSPLGGQYPEDTSQGLVVGKKGGVSKKNSPVTVL